jgi:hypothetical protein
MDCANVEDEVIAAGCRKYNVHYPYTPITGTCRKYDIQDSLPLHPYNGDMDCAINAGCCKYDVQDSLPLHPYNGDMDCAIDAGCCKYDVHDSLPLHPYNGEEAISFQWG